MLIDKDKVMAEARTGLDEPQCQRQAESRPAGLSSALSRCP